MFFICICIFLPFVIKGQFIGCDEGCMRNNECMSEGSTYTRNCYTYKCVVTKHENRTVTSGFVVESAQCIRKGKCYPDGYIFNVKERCAKRQCKITKKAESWTRRIATIDLGCLNFNGSCVSNNTIFKKGCHDYVCIVLQSQKGMYRFTKPKQIRCKSSDEECIDPGSKTVFRKEIDNKMYSKCKCRYKEKGGYQIVCRG